MEKEAQGIGSIHNYYGGIIVKEDEGKIFWAIEDWEDPYWEEIPESLYKELLAFEIQRKKDI